MKTSARNQLKGTVSEVITGKVNSEVVVNIGTVVLKAIITNDAVDDMGLASGQEVYAIIKSSFIIVSKDKPGKISARNVWATTVTDVIDGAVNCELKLSMGDVTLTSIITEDAVKDIGIAKGDTVYAIVKASSIILAQ